MWGCGGVGVVFHNISVSIYIISCIMEKEWLELTYPNEFILFPKLVLVFQMFTYHSDSISHRGRSLDVS